MAENTNVSEVSGNTQNSQPVQPAQPAVVSTPTAKYTDEDVDRIVTGKKQKAYEQGKADGLSEWQRQNNQNNATSQMIGGMPQQTQADIERLREIAREELKQTWQAQQQQLQHDHYQKEGQRIATEINAKLGEAKSRYEDFDKVVTDGAINAIAPVMLLAHTFDNTGDIAYDLIKNPAKAITVESYLEKSNKALQENNRSAAQYWHQVALAELRKHSDSIKANQTALANQPHVNEPLSQLKPSHVGADNGSRTVSDLRRDPRYRV